MPSTYAHRRFGADVLVQLPRELREKITPYRPLYDMGLHGPVSIPTQIMWQKRLSLLLKRQMN